MSFFILKYVNGDYVPDTVFDKIANIILKHPFITIFIILVIMFIFFKIVDFIKYKRSIKREYLALTKSEIRKIDPELDIDDFINKCNNVFCDFLTSYIEEDLEKLRKCMDENLYNMYLYKINAHKKSGFKYNVRKFNIEETHITDISNMNGVKNINVVIVVNILLLHPEHGNIAFNQRIARGINFVKCSLNDVNRCDNCHSEFPNTIFKCSKCGKILECDQYSLVMVKDELLKRY